MAIQTFKWSLDRYHAAISNGLIQADDRLELLRGDLIVMSPEGEPHAYYSSEIGDYLRRSLGNRAKIRENHPITLPNDSEPEPDIAVVQPLGQEYLSHHPYPENIFWLIEFSQSSLEKDLDLKKAIYAEANIQEYWVVSLTPAKLYVFRNPVQADYTSKLILTVGTISPLSFPELQIEVQRCMNV
ncbi:MAG: Uma2 family endonuclease [Oscillatoriales cyanobacterium RM1_1_9]|nr:Uma2 family endonuclease [Oscillatoriales cyanobacterium SM2_3_0]NJO44989.1 Uma2 family endonuclease [Oscillatoriales cyanobacterium RM2_1_1]NJO71930.1 Uma2 family endonuclease [Oscillatoriales cyanobacterium RM1_1_9]